MAEAKDYLNLSTDELQKYISKEFSNVLYSYPISAMEARAGIYLAELSDGSLYLDTLNLRPGVQGQGKGKEILEILKNWANENQVGIYLKPAALPDNPTYKGVELTPTEQTEKLFNFYKSNGWEENPNFTALSSNEKEAQLSLSAFKEWNAKTDDLYSPLVYLPTDVFVTDLPKNPYKDDIISYVEKYNKEGKIFLEGYNQPILDEIITEVLKMEVYFGTGGYMEEDDWKKSKLRDVAIELENNGIHPNDVDDISKYIPRDKIPTPAQIFKGGVRNEFFTDGIVDMLSKDAGSFYALNEEGEDLFPENAPKRDMRLYHAIAQENEEATKLLQEYVQDRSSSFTGRPKQLNWIQYTSEGDKILDVETPLDTPTNVVDDANVYYHSRIENLSDASDTHFGTYNAALDRASLQYGKENIKNFYTRALRDAYDELVNELDGLEYVIEDGEYTLPEKQIQFGFEHFNQAVPPKSQDIQFLIELDGYQGINLYVLDDGYPVEIERFDAGGLLYDAEEGSIETFRNTDAEYVFGRKEDFALQSEYVSRMQDGVPLDVYSGDFDVDSKYNLYEMKVKPDAKVFDISGKEIEIVNTFRKQGETTYNTKSTVVSSEFLQYELFAENAPGLGKVSEIKIDGVSYKPKSEVFQNKEEIIQVLSGDADVIIYTNEIEDAGSSSLYVRNADAVDVSLVDEERLNVFNEDVNTKYYQTSPLDEDLLRKLSQGKITQEQYDKYKQPFTDTPTNVVDDGPALLETRMKNTAKVDRTQILIPEWEYDVIKPNMIFGPNKFEVLQTYPDQTYSTGKEILKSLKAGTATDEDITRFFIYMASQSQYEIYPYHKMNQPDAIADIVKIGIFTDEIPIKSMIPLGGDKFLEMQYNLVLDNNFHLRDLDRKIVLDMVNERGQFENLKPRMRETLLNAHKKIYGENPNDYFILWRGGDLSRFNTWQSMSKSFNSASGVMYQMKFTPNFQGGGMGTYVINKNNMLDLDALGLSHGREREVIVLTEAANKPGAKAPFNFETPQELRDYKESWVIRGSNTEAYPKQGFEITNTTKRLNELGQSTQNFFNDLISGMNPDLKPNKPYEQIIELNNPQLQNAQDIYNKYVAQGGNRRCLG